MSSKEETRERGNIGKTHSLTNSRPITPAPITTSFLGTADKESAPVDDTMVFSSICKNQTQNKIRHYQITLRWKILL